MSYRTHRSSGYGCESLTELPEAPGIVARAYRTHRSSGRVKKAIYPYPGYCGTERADLTDVPGTGMNVVQNPNKLFVRVWMWSGVNHAKFHQRKFSGGELWATDEQARPLPSL